MKTKNNITVTKENQNDFLELEECGYIYIMEGAKASFVGEVTRLRCREV